MQALMICLSVRGKIEGDDQEMAKSILETGCEGGTDLPGGRKGF